VTTPVFVAASDQLAGSSVVLEGGEARHSAVVRRVRRGERVVVTDGLGRAVSGVVETVTRERVVVSVEQRHEQPASSPSLTVVQAIPKGDRAELAVELMTEVGVDVVVPFAAARCVVRWESQRSRRGVARWQAAAREAGKQSRRWRFPDVTAPADLPDVARRVARSELALLLHPSAQQPLAEVSLPVSGEILLVVGPEGGLADEEVAVLTAAGALGVRLGPTVLRSSTAGAAAAAVILSRTTRWDVRPVGSVEEE
jgi:16S rRNA (uracil1498-N3)-methyltransferase